MESLEPDAKALMVEKFDEFIKRDFCDLSSQVEYIVSAPGIPETSTNGVKRGLLVITRAEIRNIFEPVISEVQELVLNQVRSVEKKNGRVAAVLLVGGFGASEYLRKRLMACVDAEIMQPKNAWTAVVRGALQHGLEGPLISHRQARRHYGITYWAPFREGIDPESKRVWDSFKGEYKCNDIMSWYLKKGEKVADTKAVSLPWISTREIYADLRSEVFDIYCCEDDNAPTYKSFTIYSNCKLRADLSGIPKSKFERKASATAGQSDRYILRYNIEMTMDSASINFKLVIDGKQYGSVKMDFEQSRFISPGI